MKRSLNIVLYIHVYIYIYIDYIALVIVPSWNEQLLNNSVISSPKSFGTSYSAMAVTEHRSRGARCGTLGQNAILYKTSRKYNNIHAYIYIYTYSMNIKYNLYTCVYVYCHYHCHYHIFEHQLPTAYCLFPLAEYVFLTFLLNDITGLLETLELQEGHVRSTVCMYVLDD